MHIQHFLFSSFKTIKFSSLLCRRVCPVDLHFAFWPFMLSKYNTKRFMLKDRSSYLDSYYIKVYEELLQHKFVQKTYPSIFLLKSFEQKNMDN